MSNKTQRVAVYLYLDKPTVQGITDTMPLARLTTLVLKELLNETSVSSEVYQDYHKGKRAAVKKCVQIDANLYNQCKGRSLVVGKVSVPATITDFINLAVHKALDKKIYVNLGGQ